MDLSIICGLVVLSLECVCFFLAVLGGVLGETRWIGPRARRAVTLLRRERLAGALWWLQDEGCKLSDFHVMSLKRECGETRFK